MSAASFLASLKQLPCRPFTAGSERSAGAIPALAGEACLSCADHCRLASKTASLLPGLIEGAPTPDNNSQVSLEWTCPSCGQRCCEQSSALGAIALAQEITEDPLCHRCRRSPQPS